jgi:3'-phosphoadenosine 5'-phosphosulfate sulfotransferase (PAPS reductase)/FAD synthetase
MYWWGLKMNKHNYQARPNVDDVWNDFDHVVLMGGMGDDTVMLIAEMYSRGLEPNEVIFCDTGSEFPHTYEFIKYLKRWMELKNWSKLTVLNKVDRFGEPLSVVSLCEDQDTLPAAAFGAKSCSMRFKVETADKYLNSNEDCLKAWGVKKKGEPIKNYKAKILRIVGINYDEQQRANSWKPQDKWVQVFPLIDWCIGDFESEKVQEVGLYYPGKSSCYICPHLTHGELANLRDDYPHLLEKGLKIEKNYQNKNLKESSQTDLFGCATYENSTIGLGGLKGKTWGQMLQEYDANPAKYKRMTDTKPCECGD